MGSARVESSPDADPESSDQAEQASLTAHVRCAMHVIAGNHGLPAAIPPGLAVTVARLGLHSPGNIAWRALGRLAHDQSAVTPAGHWQAAALLATT